MLDVRPFQGICYDVRRVGDLAEVLVPPYDVISPQERDRYYERSSWNLIRLILGRDESGDTAAENKYTRAARRFRDWLGRGVLRKDSQPAFYCYEQRYCLEGRPVSRRGFFGAMKAVPFDAGVIHPHERIYPEPRVDRHRLIRAAQANFSSPFALYADAAGTVESLLTKDRPLFHLIDDEGIEHRLSAIRDQERLRALSAAMRDKELFLADGHHRYLTGVAIRQEEDLTVVPGAGFTLMYFLEMRSPGLTILPVHRLVRNLDPVALNRLGEILPHHFRVEELPFASESQRSAQQEELVRRIRSSKDQRVYGFYPGGNRYYVLTLTHPPRAAEPVQTVVVDAVLSDATGLAALRKGAQVDYVTDAGEALQLVMDHTFQRAFLLDRTPLEAVLNVARAGRCMPPKSTYFYPKLLSGVVMRDLRDPVPAF